MNGPSFASTATLYNLNPTFLGLQNNVVDNQPYLDTTYNGVELSASKRMSHRWQMVTGISFGKNTGGLNTTGGQSSTTDLNDPNNTLYSKGVVGLDVKVGFRLPAATSCRAACSSPAACLRTAVLRLDVFSVTSGGGVGGRAHTRQPECLPQRAWRRTAADGNNG